MQEDVSQGVAPVRWPEATPTNKARPSGFAARTSLVRLSTSAGYGRTQSSSWRTLGCEIGEGASVTACYGAGAVGLICTMHSRTLPKTGMKFGSVGTTSQERIARSLTMKGPRQLAGNGLKG